VKVRGICVQPIIKQVIIHEKNNPSFYFTIIIWASAVERNLNLQNQLSIDRFSKLVAILN